MEYYQQLKERQEEVRSLRHDVKKYILAMQAVAEHGDTEELHKIAQAATDIFERSTNVSAVGNPVVDALLNYYLRIAEKNNIKVKLDVTIPEVLTISSLSLSIILGNTFDNPTLLLNMQRTPKSSALRKSSLTQIPSMSDGAIIMKSAMVRKC